MKRLTISRLTTISNLVCDVASAFVMALAAVLLLAIGWIGLAFAIREGLL